MVQFHRAAEEVARIEPAGDQVGVRQRWLGPAACFLINGLSYLPLLYGLSVMTVGSVAAPAATGGDRSALSGFRYLAGRPTLALLVCLAGVVAMCGWPFLSLLPAFATHALGVGEQGYSMMLSGTGFGALAAALLVASFGTWERRRRMIRVGVAVLTLALPVLALTRTVPMAVGACALVGFALILFFATGQSVVQLSAGDHNRGRVMGIWAMILSGSVPLGNFITGPAADRWGTPAVLFFQGVVCGVAALFVFHLMRRARRAPS